VISETNVKMTEVNVSIIIVNYNTTLLTFQCIKSVINYTSGVSYEVILIDNASSDRSIDDVNNYFPDVKYITSAENIGFGGANNIGFETANGKYIFLLNSDAYLIDNSILEFYNFMEAEENKNIWCVGGELLDGSLFPNVSYGNFPSLSELAFALGPKLIMPKYFKENLSSGIVLDNQEPRVVDYITGADMFIRRSLIDILFDPDFFMYFEETELSFRMFKKKLNSYILPHIKLVHLAGQSFGKETSKINLGKEKIYNKSRILYFRKCKSGLYVFSVKLFLTFTFSLKSIIARDSNYLKLACYVVMI
jgi:GT2 family glycosyltransferase